MPDSQFKSPDASLWILNSKRLKQIVTTRLGTNIYMGVLCYVYRYLQNEFNCGKRLCWLKFGEEEEEGDDGQSLSKQIGVLMLLSPLVIIGCDYVDGLELGGSNVGLI